MVAQPDESVARLFRGWLNKPDQHAYLLEEAPALAVVRNSGERSKPCSDAEAAETGKLERRTSQIEAEDCAEKVQFNPFDPANDKTNITRERGENTRS